jgi:predicted N-acetyltransferase YhbS
MACDMLVKLYDLRLDSSFLTEQEQKGILIRKPLGAEKHIIIDWVRTHFGPGWASETEKAISNAPVSCFVAIRDEQVIGFGCYDATAPGFFGPVGVDEAARGQGTGKALLLACMLDMKLKGYQYAIIGWTEKAEFYHKLVGATAIPDSFPGLWKTMLK